MSMRKIRIFTDSFAEQKFRSEKEHFSPLTLYIYKENEHSFSYKHNQPIGSKCQIIFKERTLHELA